jgi:hypothetical protein
VPYRLVVFVGLKSVLKTCNSSVAVISTGVMVSFGNWYERMVPLRPLY